MKKLYHLARMSASDVQDIAHAGGHEENLLDDLERFVDEILAPSEREKALAEKVEALLVAAKEDERKIAALEKASIQDSNSRAKLSARLDLLEPRDIREVLGLTEEDEPEPDEHGSWQRYDLQTQPNGTVHANVSTNDDCDLGYPNDHASWNWIAMDREDALRRTGGGSHVGSSGCVVTVVLDGK